MNRLLILLTIPALAGCDLDVFGKNSASREAYQYRQAGLIAPTSPTMPVKSPTEVTDGGSPSSAPPEPEPEITVAQETVYVPPEPKPDCTADLYMIFKCVEGRVVLL